MNRKISGCFDAETGSYPVTFLPGFEVKYNSGHITVFKAAPAAGTPWPASARQRRIHQAWEEEDISLMNKVVPFIEPLYSPEEELAMEITLSSSAGVPRWSFEFDSGIMKIFDGSGMEIAFSGDREQGTLFMFRGRRFSDCRIISGKWRLEEQNGIYCCFAENCAGSTEIPCEERWKRIAEKKHAWWYEAFLLTRYLPEMEENKRIELLTAVHQLLMYPEDEFFFDGNFFCWSQAMRKLKFAEPLKKRMQQICGRIPVWNYNAQCFAGIDDGLRLPRRCDMKGNPQQFDWLIALDVSPSCLTAMEMFEYCNVMHDMAFLKSDVFNFMKQVMQVVELSIEPEGSKLSFPCSPLPGGKRDSLASCGKNADRQLYFIHCVIERLLKACEMLGEKADPVWLDIRARLPKARGIWHLQPDTSWGRAGKKICEMLP